MPRTPTKHSSKGGGPEKVNIDWAKFDTMCEIKCTQEEIAGYFDCSPDTISRAVLEHSGRSFAEYLKARSSRGSVSLRRAQIQKALAGNPSMLIWLGKQYLGQTDKAVVTVESNPADDISAEVLTEIARKHKEPHRRSKQK